MRVLWISTILVAFGCGSSGGDDRASDGSGLSGIGGTVGDATDGMGGTGASAGTSAGAEGTGDDSTPSFDLPDPTGADDGGPGAEGCRKVDVILAVDNSGSMSEEHEALQGPVFDSFPQALLDINNGIDDFQLGVINGCPKPGYLHDWGTGGACNYSTGANYMVSTSPDLAGEFACVTTFPDDGYQGQPDNCIDSGDFKDDDEQPGLAAAEVVSPANVVGNNAGFLRDEALLFIVAITDEDEEVVDADSEMDIYQRIVDAKGGDVTRVVYLGIAGDSNCEGPYGSADDAVRSKTLAALFEAQGQGMFWDLCQGNLELAFQTAISTIVDEACQSFVPVG